MRYWREIDLLAKQFAIRFGSVTLVVSWCKQNKNDKQQAVYLKWAQRYQNTHVLTQKLFR